MCSRTVKTPRCGLKTVRSFRNCRGCVPKNCKMPLKIPRFHACTLHAFLPTATTEKYSQSCRRYREIFLGNQFGSRLLIRYCKIFSDNYSGNYFGCYGMYEQTTIHDSWPSPARTLSAHIPFFFEFPGPLKNGKARGLWKPCPSKFRGVSFHPEIWGVWADRERLAGSFPPFPTMISSWAFPHFYCLLCSRGEGKGGRSPKRRGWGSGLGVCLIRGGGGRGHRGNFHRKVNHANRGAASHPSERTK